jgi:hypothetical protein
MHDLTAKRTLVKSPPELWSEVSEVERLARHLDAFGEITITKLEPEHTVAWEGEGASGTVSIEPAGWGTKVTLRAQLEEAAVAEPAAAGAEIDVPEIEEPTPESAATEESEPTPPSIEASEPARSMTEAPEPAPPIAEAPEVEEPDASPADQPEPPRRRGLFARLFGRRKARRTLADEGESARAAEHREASAMAGEAEEGAVAEAPAAEEPDAEDPVAEDPVADEPPPEPSTAEHAQAILDEVLDTLGSAHHRPFSRG